jgi:hypothetical protein
LKSPTSVREPERERERKRESASDRKRERGKKREKESERPLSCTRWQSYKISAFSVCVCMCPQELARVRGRGRAHEKETWDWICISCWLVSSTSGGERARERATPAGTALQFPSPEELSSGTPQRFPSMECKGVCRNASRLWNARAFAWLSIATVAKMSRDDSLHSLEIPSAPAHCQHLRTSRICPVFPLVMCVQCRCFPLRFLGPSGQAAGNAAAFSCLQMTHLRRSCSCGIPPVVQWLQVGYW